MAKVALFTLPAQKHLNPSMPFVKELASRGEAVTYYTLEPFRQIVEGAGACFRPHIDHGFSNEPLSKNEFRISARLYDVTQPIAEDLLPALRQDPPDYIIHDSFCPWGKVLASALDVPAIASVHGMALNDAFFRKYSKVDRETVFKSLRSLPPVIRMWRRAAQLRRHFTLPPPTLSELMTNPEPLNLVYTSRLFHPVSESFDDSYKFVGPTIVPRAPVPFPIERIRGEGPPVVYIALGTVYHDNLDLYKNCVKALGGAPYRVALAVGPSTDPAKLGEIPENIVVQRIVPQLEILQHADVFVSHGGMKSVNESLYFDVPLVVVPQGVDQPVLAKRVAELGAGVVLTAEQSTPLQLRSAVDKIVNEPSYRQQARVVGASLREAGGYVRAVDEVMTYTRQQGIGKTSSLQPPEAT